MRAPGPWKVAAYPKLVEVRDAAGAVVVSWMGFDDSAIPLARHRANARLIAAAPELLEACKAVLRDISLDTYRMAAAGWGLMEPAEQAIAKVRVAIAKAEGKE